LARDVADQYGGTRAVLDDTIDRVRLAWAP
jgi:hypothetical protein